MANEPICGISNELSESICNGLGMVKRRTLKSRSHPAVLSLIIRANNLSISDYCQNQRTQEKPSTRTSVILKIFVGFIHDYWSVSSDIMKPTDFQTHRQNKSLPSIEHFARRKFHELPFRNRCSLFHPKVLSGSGVIDTY